MSLYGMMRTGVSGMQAQANRLSTTADNIANSGTTGYKRSGTEFSTLVISSLPGSYNSGGVTTTVVRSISQQGVLQNTTSTTDLAVDGNGFFIVADANGQPFLTRAGSFVPDGDGNLVNAAGFRLLGYDYSNGTPTATVNGFDGLQPVTISQTALTATPSTAAYFSANLPYGATAVAAGSLPSDNAATSTYTAKSSLVAYDNVGQQVLLDVYFTKTGADTWEVSVFDQSQGTADTGFPYAGGALATATLTFNGTTGQVASTSPNPVAIPVPNGASMTFDLSSMSQLGATYTVFDGGANGNPPSAIQDIQISSDGTLYAQFEDGSLRALYRIPLADVPSSDNLKPLTGNVFVATAQSGDVRIGFPSEGQLGKVASGRLESSNVDIAEELTSMIESQRSYTANSKVFQTGSDLMDILINLKR